MFWPKILPDVLVAPNIEPLWEPKGPGVVVLVVFPNILGVVAEADVAPNMFVGGADVGEAKTLVFAVLGAPKILVDGDAVVPPKILAEEAKIFEDASGVPNAVATDVAGLAKELDVDGAKTLVVVGAPKMFLLVAKVSKLLDVVEPKSAEAGTLS